VRNPSPESDIAAAAATSDTGAQSAAAGFLADLCRRTNGGVDATREDIEAARRITYELLERHTITARDAAGTGITPGTVTEAARRETEKLVGTKWCMVGCVQRTLPSPASWLASPFFWVAKEAQHESYRLTQVDRLFPPFKFAATLAAGSPPKTGEEWVAAFGRREVAAVFPFSVLESLLNGLEVPFSSGAATLEFHHDYGVLHEGDGGSWGAAAGTRVIGESQRPMRMVSRVSVDFDQGRVAGDLVTECVLVETVAGVDREVNRPADEDWKRDGARGGGDGDSGSSSGTVLDVDVNGSRTATSTATTTTAACLVSTRFEGTHTALDGVVVPSGRIMSALMCSSPNLRRQQGPGGLPGVTYRKLYVGSDTLVVQAGSCEATSTLLVYERT